MTQPLIHTSWFLSVQHLQRFLQFVIWRVYGERTAMSFVDTLRLWDEAVTCVDKEDLSEALRIFLSIEEPNSKICFNMGCLHLLKEDLDAAEKVQVLNVGNTSISNQNVYHSGNKHKQVFYDMKVSPKKKKLKWPLLLSVWRNNIYLFISLFFLGFW